MKKRASHEPFSLPNGSIIALQAASGHWVSRINYGGEHGKNHVEVAKSPRDVSCHFTVIALANGKVALQAENGHYICIVEKEATSILMLEDGHTFYRKPEKFFWIMTEQCSLDQAAGFLPIKSEQEKIAFQAENGLYLGHKKSYTFDTRHPLFLVKSQKDLEVQTNFTLHMVRSRQSKQLDKIDPTLPTNASILRVIEPFRSADRWYDQGNFNDTSHTQNENLSINAFSVQAGDIVDGIQAFYSEKFIPLAPPHGNINEYSAKITLEPGDTWSEISGFYGDWFGGNYVLQLTFHTHQGRTYGPFGSMNYAQNIHPFHLIIQPDEKIVALSGVVSSGDNGRNSHLGALGLVLRKNE
jgi:hypothetical protein